MLQKTKYRILRYLFENEAHGYQISKDLPLSLTTIYSHLSELEKEEFIKVVKLEKRRKVYGVTSKGQKLIRLMDNE